MTFFFTFKRHYGSLQGLDKVQTVEIHGEKQVAIWRRAYDIRPPPLPDNDPSFPGLQRAYADVKPELLPRFFSATFFSSMIRDCSFLFYPYQTFRFRVFYSFFCITFLFNYF